MTLSSRFSGIALAAVLVAGALASPRSAKAEDLVDFLWGGGAEYGGGRSIVSFDPQYKPNQIIVSFSDRRIYLITKPGEAITYPVAVPMGEARWQGVTFVSTKKVNPAWTPTPDMVRANPRLPHWVPGGHPMNPLGIRAMYLGSSAYRIHGTDAPWTIGQAVSHGCIRMTNEDVLDLYPRVPVGMRVTVTWQRFNTHAVSSNEYPSYSSASAEKDGNSASSTPVSYSTSGKGTRTASSRPSDGGISNIFFWDDEKQQKAPVAEPAAPAEQEPAVTSASPSSTSASAASASAAPLSIVAPAKKKSASTSSAPTPKKKTDAATAEATPASAPAAHTMAFPDPVKPREGAPADPVAAKPAATKTSDASSELTPVATKASASASEGLPVQKASAEAQ